jgi:2-polyprenyl-3-methyl-5-hydroxy-6-metoxy-1,4-benzoquinol methylase
MSYREELFANYRTVQALPAKPDLAGADHWGQAYDTYLRGWLPANAEARIADIACGNGYLLRFFLKRGYRHVQGVDISAEQLAVARQICEHVQLQNGTEFMLKHPATFDLITALDLIEHLTKDELLKFLRAAHGALRPGGRLVLQTPNCASPQGIAVRHADFTHEIGLTPNSLAWLLRLTGYENHEAREQGPVCRGLKSSVRWLLWRMLRLTFIARDLIESGSAQQVYTRVFVASATKPGQRTTLT